MKFFILLGLLVVFDCTVQLNAAATRDDFGDTVEDSDVSEAWFEDENGNLVWVDINEEPEDDESVDDTRNDLSNRVFFQLYTKDNPRTPQQLWVNNDNALRSSNYDPRRPTRVVTHGWVNSANSDSCTMIRDAYLQQGDYNVIVTDWSIISKRGYNFSQRRVKIVGEWLARFLDFLEKRGTDLSKVLLVGHSLGAHIVGLAGHQVTNRVGYVVGLDPALPAFYWAQPGERISRNDATVVQIIHTNGGTLGMSAALGDIDFYPNGGSSQNGCIIDIGGSCSHSRAYKYFAESINSDRGFWGTECGSWRSYRWNNCNNNRVALMGGKFPETTATGSYYFYTNRGRPYAQGR